MFAVIRKVPLKNIAHNKFFSTEAAVETVKPKRGRPAKKVEAAPAETAAAPAVEKPPKVSVKKIGTYCGDKEKWVDAGIATQTGLPLETINAVLKSYYDVLSQGILDGKSHSVTNFGSYYLKQVAATNARNPKTQEPIQVKPKKKVDVKFSKKTVVTL